MNSTWSNSQCKRIAEQTGLSVAQVYKWGWDKKNRLAIQRYPECEENMPPMMPPFTEGMDQPHQQYQQSPFGAPPHLSGYTGMDHMMPSFSMHGMGFWTMIQIIKIIS